MAVVLIPPSPINCFRQFGRHANLAQHIVHHPALAHHNFGTPQMPDDIFRRTSSSFSLFALL
jgi:hypothetical protein